MPTGRISCDSDNFVYGNDYAGAIIYTINGSAVWSSGRSFYIIIKCTNYWSDEAFNSPGQGAVHKYLIEQALGYDLSNSSDRNSICGDGFAYYNGALNFNSILNEYGSSSWPSDGNRGLSIGERRMVEHCWNQYISRGPGSTFPIPPYFLI